MRNLNLRLALLCLVATTAGVSFGIQSKSESDSTKASTGKPPLLGCGKCDGLESTIMIVNEAGLCLDADRDTIKSDGTRIQVWTCTPNQTPQQWRFHKVGAVNGMDRYQIINAEGGKCLDVDKPHMSENGAKVQLWKCTGVIEQEWFVRNNTIVNAGGQKCLDVATPRTHDGAIVRAWTCGPQRQQTWTSR